MSIRARSSPQTKLGWPPSAVRRSEAPQFVAAEDFLKPGRYRQLPSAKCQMLPVLHYVFRKRQLIRAMLLSKEYVGYLAREVTKKLIAGGHIETKAVPAVTEKVHAAMLEELSLEDRINDEVRVILEAYSEEMRRTGANYQEMFRKVKSELTRKYKAVL
jgi:Protein of unknown function (DUF507)